jgi:hypothetical protein
VSGGSFDYLCYQGLQELAENIELLEEMAEVLEEEGSTQAAKDTLKIIEQIKGLDVPEPLRNVWRAVEWWKSCDWGKEQAMEVIAKYDARAGKMEVDGESQAP